MAANNKCILVYGLKNEDIKKIESQNIKVIEVNNNMALMTLEHIIQGDVHEGYYDELPQNEKVIVFNSFKDQQLKVTIKFIREFIQGGVLAIGTPQNYKWTFKYLLEHLIEEREWFQSQQKGRK